MTARNRIVVIDDSIVILWISRQFLELGGFDVLTLDSTAGLIPRIKNFNPGLIFLDHDMPEMNGIEVMELIRGDDSCKDIPVVYFTANENIKELAKEAGADDWLPKPFLYEEMIGMAAKFF